MEDRSHITCVRFGTGGKRDFMYTAHSVGYITLWRCAVDPAAWDPALGGASTATGGGMMS